MTYLELTKKLGLIRFVALLMDELGYQNKEIADKLQITEPTLYNARKDFHVLSEALKAVENIESLQSIPTTKKSKSSALIVTDGKNSIVSTAQKEVFGNPDVHKIIECFKEAFGTTTASKYDRWAAHRLAKKYGADEIIKVIQFLATHTMDKYCPTVNSVSQLDKKWVNVAAFFKRMQGEEAIEL